MLFSTRSKILMLAFAAALAAGLAGCHKQTAVQGPHATPVGVQVAELSDEIVKSELPGRLTAYRTAEVRPQVTGIILKRLFEEGSQVQEGQSLYQIDPTLYKAAVAQATASVAQAEANLRLAQADAKRSKSLLASKAVSEQADEAAQAKYKVAQANLLAAKENLRYTEVKSPIPGRVSLSEVTPGALVTANQAARLTVVQQLDPIYMDVQQSYEALAKLKSQLATGYLKKDTNGEADVTITLADGQVYPYKGKLMFKDALVDETTGSVRLRAVFPNPDGTLLPGMFARAKAVDGVREKVIRISQKAVMRAQNGNPYVFVVNKSNRVESRDVVLHYADGTDWVLEKGLSAGDVVIVDGTLRVRVNDLVSFKSDKTPAAK